MRLIVRPSGRLAPRTYKGIIGYFEVSISAMALTTEDEAKRATLKRMLRKSIVAVDRSRQIVCKGL
jgi:hypothetical protein